MVEKIRKHGKTLSLVLGILGFGGVAGAVYAVCFSNVEVYYPDGTAETCSTFCTVGTSGYVKMGCRPLI